MRRKILIYTMLSLVTCALSAQDVTGRKITWDYPVKPGTKEWKSLKSAEEQFEAYNIPAGIIKNISTEELIKTCLSYPEWGLIHAYNDRPTGLSVIVSLFNGFQELFNRDDAARELIKVYVKLDPLAVKPDWTQLQQGQYAFQFTRIELLLMQKAIIGKLDNKGILELKEIAISKYRNKKRLPEIYSLWDLSPTAGICLNIFEKREANVTNNDSAIKLFKHYLMSDDIGVLDKIVGLLEKNEL